MRINGNLPLYAQVGIHVLVEARRSRDKMTRTTEKTLLKNSNATRHNALN